MQQTAVPHNANASEGGKKLPPPSAKGGFVVNLAASTTPVTLVQPSHAALKEYTFFVSRRREDGRERFRLHMGYFESQHDAEQMLDAVRDIFPAAWAGVAPGRKLAAEASGAKIIRPAPQNVPQVIVAAASIANSEPATLTPPTTAVVPAVQPVPQPAQQAATASLDSVRAAIASLDDVSREGLTAKQTVDSSVAEMKLLSETQTMRLLESRRQQEQADKAGHVVAPPVADFAGYAVQLRWSTRPIDISQLPAMAIFDAYTLYNAEGSNGAQHWHSLRLGFFTDADSAKQVANYVRSEFASAAIVPIGVAERNGAQTAARGATAAKPVSPTRSGVSGEFRLIDDVKTPVVEAPLPVVTPPPQSASSTAVKSKAKPSRSGTRQPAEGRRLPMTIEETLEVLGANTLTLETKRGAGLSGATSSAMLHAARRKSPQKSKLGLLFEKLAERIAG